MGHSLHEPKSGGHGNGSLAGSDCLLGYGDPGTGFVCRVAKRFPAASAYRLLPFVIAAAFVMLSVLPKASPGLGILIFGLAGLGCSALLPLTISFGQEELTAIAAAVAGGLIAFYQMGYGIAAFGVGPLEDNAGLSLNILYGLAAAVALVLAALSFVVTRPNIDKAQLQSEK